MQREKKERKDFPSSIQVFVQKNETCFKSFDGRTINFLD